jgi:hypothetical protein
MIATIGVEEWLKLCAGWQTSSVNVASKRCSTIPSVSGIPPSITASTTSAAQARSAGHRDLVAGFRTAPLPI